MGGGLHAGLEALAAGVLLVEGGDVDRLVVVAVDETGPATRALAGDAVVSGAVALLLSASQEDARARVGELHVRRGDAGGREATPIGAGHGAGHLALLPLLDDRFAGVLTSTSPPDAAALVRIEPV